MSRAFKMKFRSNPPSNAGANPAEVMDDSRSAKHGKIIEGHHKFHDNVSELSGDESSIASRSSKSSALRSKFLPGGKRFRKKGTSSEGTQSVGSATGTTSRSKSNPAYRNDEQKAATANPAAPSRSTRHTVDITTARSSVGSQPVVPARNTAIGAASVGAASVGSASRPRASQTNEQRLMKDAKSRFNIGLVYLKTKDYAKAQENLEHSLYCHIQLSGHDSKLYTNDSLFAIASVREKLGDCYDGNAAIVDKCLALDHYEEARRLLKSVDPEDAPPNVTELLERVEEKLNKPELCQSEPRKPPSVGVPLPPKKYERGYKGGNRVGVRVGAAAGIGAASTATTATRAGSTATTATSTVPPATAAATPQPEKSKGIDEEFFLGVKKGFGKIGGFAHGIKDTIEDAFDYVEDVVRGEAQDVRESFTSGAPVDNNFDMVMAHLERENHRTALNHLSSIQMNSPSMKDAAFRAQMVEHMMTVGDSAFKAGKIGVATDAFEEAFAIQKLDDEGGRTLKVAMRGCIKGHKLLACEEEKKGDYYTSIQHRNRVYQLLEMDDRTVAASQQLLMIAYLHGQVRNYEQSSETLNDAVRGLFKGVPSLDKMPKDRIPLLIKCYHSRAICYAKLKQWKQALDQYEEVLPLVARQEGISSKEYNSLLIHKAVLMVSIGEYAKATTMLRQYVKFSEEQEGNVVIDETDHYLALDTCAAACLRMGEVDCAIEIFQKKLALAKTLPKNDEVKSETMHKLGCLLAYKRRHADALPLLNSALDMRKYLYDGKSSKIFESSWAVAATEHTLGESRKALKEYSVLLEKINKVEDVPIDAAIIHNAAGVLSFEEGNTEKAVKSFREALKGADFSQSPNLKPEIMLNLANALSAKGDVDASIKIYDDMANMPSIEGTKLLYLSLYNKCLLLIKKGESEEAKPILHELTNNRSKIARDVRGSAFMSLGHISCSEGDIEEALHFFDKSLSMFTGEYYDLNSVTQVKKSIGMAYLDLGQYDTAIDKLEDILGDLSSPDMEGKPVNLLKADVWCQLGRIYNKKGDIHSAKNFFKLALQAHKANLGEDNPVTLRNVSNLAVLLLEEAENLPESQSKSTIDAAKFEIEEALDKFVSLNDLWTYRLDVASLKTNLALIAVWQKKPKKARKLLRQIKEIEIPPNHPLQQRMENLEQRLESLEKSK